MKLFWFDEGEQAKMNQCFLVVLTPIEVRKQCLHMQGMHAQMVHGRQGAAVQAAGVRAGVISGINL